MSSQSDSRPVSAYPERWALVLLAAAAAALAANAALGPGPGGGPLAVLHPVLLTLAFASLLAAVRARLARRAAEERGGAGGAAARPPAGARLFDDGDELEGLPLSRERALGQFERLAGWAAVPALAALQAGGALYAAARLREGLAAGPTPWPAVVALAAEAFLFFVAARCLLAWSRSEPEAGFLAAGQYAGLACAACLAVAAALVLPDTLRSAAAAAPGWGVAAVLALAAAESAVRALGAFYRPAGAARARLWDESLVAGFFAEPASWWRRLCASLDYQFGFAVSRTWAFRLAARALPPFALLAGLLLYLSSSLVLLGPEEAAVLERFGRPPADGAVLGPGLHLVRPWPFERARRFPVRRLQSFSLGVRLDETEAPPLVILWDVPHYREEDYVLVAGRREAGPGDAGQAVPASLLVMNIPVEYMVTNLHQFLYVHADPAGLLTRLAARAVTLEAAGRDLFAFFGQGQLRTAESLRQSLQAEADRLGLGTRILFVGLQGVHPPVPVAPAFQQVVGAVEEQSARVWAATAYARRLLPLAQADADARLLAARAAAYRRAETAAAEADLFLARSRGEAAAPAVFRARLLLDALTDGLGRARKYLVAVEPGREVLSLNLESRLSRDLFDFALGTNTPSGGTPP